MLPLGIAAARLFWDQFATLTFIGNRLGHSVNNSARNERLAMLKRWIRKIEKSFGIPRGELVYLAREERGEETARYHWHVLVLGLNHVTGRGVIPSPNPEADRHRLQALWKRCGAHAGESWIRPYDARLSGASYILKGLEFSNFNPQAGNCYELSKFTDSEDRQLIAAPSFFSFMGKKSRNRRHQKARVMKRATRDRSTHRVSKSVPRSKGFRHPADTSLRQYRKSSGKDWSWKPGTA